MENKNYLSIAQNCIDAPYRAQQKAKELAQLLEVLEPLKLKNILEIGFYNGGTIRAWSCIADEKANIVGVDYGDTPVADIVKYLSSNQTLTLIQGDSHKQEIFKAVKEQAKYDMIFIDGDHAYEGVKKDWEMYSKLVKKGGVVVFHDIVKHTVHVDVGVHILWNEIKEKGKGYKEFIDTEYKSDWGLWGGIGVLYL